MSYRTEIVGIQSGDLGDLLDKVSQLKTLEDRFPASAVALRRRAERDIDTLREAAHSLGYWDAHLSVSIDSKAEPAKVVITVSPGPLYHVSEVAVLGPDGQALVVPGTGSLPLKPGDPAQTAPVLAAETALVARFADSGHPFAKVLPRRVVIDNGTGTMAVTYRIDPGPVMRFGRATISGLERLDAGYVELRLRWRAGAIYDAAKVEATRLALLESGLFSTVAITPSADATTPGAAAMTIAATERAHRTIGAGLAYNTSQGAAARAFWENRNLFGNAEYLKLDASVGQQIDAVAANFRRPDFLATSQDLLATAEVANDTPVAYRSRRALGTIGVERRFGPLLTGGVSFEAEAASVVQLAALSPFTAAERTQSYKLLGIPAYVKLDTTDNLLDPTRGWRAQLAVTPAHTISSPDLTFVSSFLSASTYHQIGAGGRVVLAGKLALASLDGAPLADLPADQRIYAGGGGSIRPYGYEMAGPLDSSNVPIGGKSSLVGNFEARIKITPTIGLVPFVDAGSYYETNLPQFGQRLFYGVGLGLRYYTAFGPLRLDLATPLYKRAADSAIQVYISLGQAF
ncbi:MAG TPA: BamA/TamA family outer membrane protein [Stellaceae bacterium]